MGAACARSPTLGVTPPWPLAPNFIIYARTRPLSLDLSTRTLKKSLSNLSNLAAAPRLDAKNPDSVWPSASYPTYPTYPTYK